MAKSKKAPKPKKKEEMWKCAACPWEGPKSLLKDLACPTCKSEDVFPRDDGLWEQGREDQARAAQNELIDGINYPDD